MDSVLLTAPLQSKNPSLPKIGLMYFLSELYLILASGNVSIRLHNQNVV
jgi:hypothetical protein